MYKAEILADSINEQGNRLTTMKVTFPRFILAEFNTHRMFSRNSASSRAIPFKKMVKMVEENPFIPIAWQKDHKGMQGTEYFTKEDEKFEKLKQRWLQARDHAVFQASKLSYYGLTKQLCNRLLEPFMWHTVLVTATEWSNFFELRCPKYQIDNVPTVNLDGSDSDKKLSLIGKSKKELIKAISEIKNPLYDDLNTILENYTELEWLSINKSQADIHIQAIAELMWDAMNESAPKQLKAGEWHIPYGDNFDDVQLGLVTYLPINDQYKAIEQSKIKIATARCARISYQTLGDNPEINYEKDIKLHDMLAESGHWSPFEHCARVMNSYEYETYINGQGTAFMGESGIEFKDKNNFGWCRNFRGFIQYRSILDNGYN